MKLSEKISKGEAGLAAYFVGGTILIALIIFVVYAVYSVKSAEPIATKDKASGEKVIEANTGAPGNGVALIGFDALTENGIKSEPYVEIVKTISNFFDLAFPKYERLSYVANSIAFSDETYDYGFKAKSNTGDEFDIRVNGLNATNYQVKIYNAGNLLLDYDSSKEALITKSAGQLWKDLPFTFTLSDKTQGQFVYYQSDDGERSYYISVNTCGNEKLKQEARTKVYSFLQRNNYDPSEITINFPDTCDGEAHGE